MKNDKIFKYIVLLGTLLATFTVFFIVFFIFKECLPLLNAQSIKQILLGKSWFVGVKKSVFGFLPMIMSTLYISLVSCVVATFIGLGCAMFLSYIKDVFNNKCEIVIRMILSFIDMLAGVPSVVFGFIGLLVLVKFIEKHSNLATGETVLAGIIVLSIMLLPYIVTSLYESIEKEKEKYLSTSLSLGVSKAFTYVHIINPNILKKVLETSLMAFCRAIGETMAVMMVTGNSKIMPKMMGRAETLSSLIALEIGTAEYKSLHYSALYMAGFILIVIMLIIHLIVNIFLHEKKTNGGMRK